MLAQLIPTLTPMSVPAYRRPRLVSAGGTLTENPFLQQYYYCQYSAAVLASIISNYRSMPILVLPQLLQLARGPPSLHHVTEHTAQSTLSRSPRLLLGPYPDASTPLPPLNLPCQPTSRWNRFPSQCCPLSYLSLNLLAKFQHPSVISSLTYPLVPSSPPGFRY